MTELEQRVRAFMVKAEQATPISPAIPSDDVCKLRLKLIAEEFLELADALGFLVIIANAPSLANGSEEKHRIKIIRESSLPQDLVEAVDGVGDLQVVVEGTGIALGVSMRELVWEVCDSNDSKFVDGYKREDGKWVKGPSYRPANLKPIIQRQIEAAKGANRQQCASTDSPTLPYDLRLVKESDGAMTWEDEPLNVPVQHASTGTVAPCPAGCDDTMARVGIAVAQSFKSVEEAIRQGEATRWQGLA